LPLNIRSSLGSRRTSEGAGEFPGWTKRDKVLPGEMPIDMKLLQRAECPLYLGVPLP
jgi:hypothetical protein